MRTINVLVLLLLTLGTTSLFAQEYERIPSGKKLSELVRRYLEADAEERIAIRAECDKRFGPLDAKASKKLAKAMLKAASKVGTKIAWKGTNRFYKDENTGKYISRKGNKTLFLGLHGGGVGVGSAESAAGAQGGGGWSWIYPEVLRKTGRGWVSPGTEEFVIELIRAAKRSGKVDPDRIYITGHSMGGFGTWTIGAHHADVFAGTAAYAGAPGPIDNDGDYETCEDIEAGILENLYNLRHFFYQSLDDKQVRAPTNVCANKLLTKLKEEHPAGFDFKYLQVDDRGHAAPKEGYMPSLKWVAKKKRDPRPKKILWEPVLTWKRHFYWLWWQTPEENSMLEAEVKDGNTIEIKIHDGATDGLGKFSVFVDERMLDTKKEIVLIVDGEERFRGTPERRMSTLLMTLPRHDPHLLFDRRIDLDHE